MFKICFAQSIFCAQCNEYNTSLKIATNGEGLLFYLFICFPVVNLFICFLVVSLFICFPVVNYQNAAYFLYSHAFSELLDSV